MSDVPASIEVLIESARRSAAALDDHDLDETIATVAARRDVAAAHGRTPRAEAWQAVLLGLCEVRTALSARHCDPAALLLPDATVRALTEDELGEESPPC